MRAASALLPVLVALSAPPTFGQPDLAPEIYGVAVEHGANVDPADVAEGCAGATSGRTLIHFGFRTHNVGDAPEVIGDPGCPAPCVDFPNQTCANPDFVCSPLAGHNHPHFQSFATYELLDWRGNLVTKGGKRGFCLTDDSSCGTGTYSCTNQGISPGCFDDYHPTLGCQYIDATDVVGIDTRAFIVRGTSDPLDLLVDADRSNNTTEAALPGARCGNGTVDPGEACDPSVLPDGVCCDDDCHAIPDCDSSCEGRPAGALCRPATGPCDAAEACDGVSPACPPDTRLAEGAPCGDVSDLCVSNVCRSGACVAERAHGGCLIGATCYAPDAIDPTNACQVCDPALNIDVWSADHDPTAKGVKCQLGRVQSVSQGIGCPARVTHRIVTNLARAQRAADQLGDAPPAAAARIAKKLVRLDRRLQALLTRGAKRGCRAAGALDELQALLAQLHGMRAATR